MVGFLQFLRILHWVGFDDIDDGARGGGSEMFHGAFHRARRDGGSGFLQFLRILRGVGFDDIDDEAWGGGSEMFHKTVPRLGSTSRGARDRRFGRIMQTLRTLGVVGGGECIHSPEAMAAFKAQSPRFSHPSE